MASSVLDVLTSEQSLLLDSWLGQWAFEEDMSWGVQDIHVLRLRTPRGLVVAKASATSHHIRRELRAHRDMMAPLESFTPGFLHGDARAGLIVTAWLPGRLVAGGPAEFVPDTFEQAGRLLALFHRPRHETTSYDPAALNKIDDFLGRAEGLVPPHQLRAVRALAAAHRPAPRVLFATHGDYQPRNWVEDGGRIGVIDFGRAGYRPWVTDLVRLEHEYFASDAPRLGPTYDGAALRAAFYAGYGREPAEEPQSWRLDNILQSLGTVVWAHDVGDARFEETGRQMIRRVLDGFAP